MKNFFKIGCLGFIGIIVLIVIIAVVSSGGEDTTSDSDNASSEDNSSSNKEQTEEPAELPGIGEAVEVGAMTYTINEVSTSDEVGPSIMSETANGKYIILNITAVNNGNEAVTIDGSYFKLMQGETTFDADSAASMSANQAEDGSIQNSFFMEQLNPGSEMEGNVVFDVTAEVAESDDLTVQAQEGIFGSVTEEIDLSK